VSYTAAIDRANPTAFIFLIDQSRSTTAKMDLGVTKAKLVGDVLNKTLFQLITRCASADGVRDYFDLGVLVYNGFGARSGFGGALHANSLHPISSIAAHPLRIEERNKRIPDGAGGLVDQSVKFPVWIESVGEGDTPMCEGFRKAAECLVRWCNSHAKSYPPTIIHVAGGPSTDGDPEQLAEAIRHISTNHGQCLLYNLHVGTSGASSAILPASATSLPDAYSKTLFRMSSLIPAHLITLARERGYRVSSESRFFGYKAGYEDLVNFFDIGTRVSNLLLQEPTSPESDEASPRPITGSGTGRRFPQVNLQSTVRANTQPTDPVTGTSPGPADPQPPKHVGGTSGYGRRPGWLQSARLLGFAVAVITVIVLFKLFEIGRGPQPTQLFDQTPIIAAKDDSASKRPSSDNAQSTSLFAAPNVPAVDSSSEHGSVLVSDPAKTSPPADNGPKLAGATEQATEQTPVQASTPPPKNIDLPKVAETSASDQSSPTVDLDLTKEPDAKRVQQRLIDLGYFSGPVNGIWGPKSRHALSEFRTAEKIGQDDHWDQATEEKLFSDSTARREQSLAFVGGWSKDASSCADDVIKITAIQAISRGATCHFGSIRQEAVGRWSVQAHCELALSLRTADTDNSWTSNVKLTLNDRRLTWASEKGAEDYYRCSQ
jgi:hypothetical protein